MFHRFALALALAAPLAGCGGAAPSPSPSGPSVGGSGEVPGQTPPAPVPPAPSDPAPVVAEPSPWFGVRNATGVDVVAYAWYETRANVPAPFPGGHWYNVVPLGLGIPPGGVRLLPVFEDGRPIFEPAAGPLDVAAFLRDGRVIVARILYAPPASALWVVR